MKLITYPERGGVGVIIPSDHLLTIEEIAERDVPEGVSHLIVDNFDVHDIYDGYLPAFDYDEQAGPVVNLSKAKAIHLNKFRDARAPKLEALDIAFMRAVEQGDTAKQADIATQKKTLRDITKIPLPDTLPEIKKVWPDILKA